jgi:hypothetical protein
MGDFFFPQDCYGHLDFCNIENIHAMRDSWNKMHSLVNSTSAGDHLTDFGACVEKTGWLKHCRYKIFSQYGYSSTTYSVSMDIPVQHIQSV